MFSYIEASAHAACITLFSNVVTFLVFLIFVQFWLH